MFSRYELHPKIAFSRQCAGGRHVRAADSKACFPQQIADQLPRIPALDMPFQEDACFAPGKQCGSHRHNATSSAAVQLHPPAHQGMRQANPLNDQLPDQRHASTCNHIEYQETRVVEG